MKTLDFKLTCAEGSLMSYEMQCRTQGGPEGHVPPPPPKRPKVPLKTTKNRVVFFHVLLKEYVGEGAQIEL